MNRNQPLFARGRAGNLWWPEALPRSNLDYVLEATQRSDLDYSREAGEGYDDPIATAALSLNPNGAGEMQALDLSVLRRSVVVQLSGGQPGRVYLALAVVTGISGRVWPYLVRIRLGLGGALPWEVPPPTVAGFGTPLIWTPEAVVFGAPFATVATGLLGTGTDQATATPLLAFTNEIASAPGGGGFILPAVGVVSGTFVVQNDDPVNAVLIYPPVGAQIRTAGTTLAVNAPFVLGSTGARISFSTNSPSTLWVAG